MGQSILMILYIVFMIGLFYLIVFIPENRRKKKYRTMVDSLKLNDEIMTKGGILGKIINIGDDYVIIQTGPDRAKIKLSKAGVSNVTKESAAAEIK